MPLFSNKANRNFRTRRCSSLSSIFRNMDLEGKVNNHKELQLKLGDNILVFDNQTGEWSNIQEHNSNLVKLQKNNEMLKEENRLLKLKIEILLDLATSKSDL